VLLAAVMFGVADTAMSGVDRVLVGDVLVVDVIVFSVAAGSIFGHQLAFLPLVGQAAEGVEAHALGGRSMPRTRPAAPLS
jgi:hypothetical protein